MKHLRSYAAQKLVRALGRAPLRLLARAMATHSRESDASDSRDIEQVLVGEPVLQLGESVSVGPLYHLVQAMGESAYPASIRRRAHYRHKDERGFTINVDLCRYPESAYYFRDPNPALSRWLMSHPGRTMLDVGANVGFFSLTAALTYDRVFSFEPNPLMSAALRENYVLNNLPTSRLVEMGLGDRAGQLSMWINGQSPGSGSFFQGRNSVGRHLNEVVAGISTLDAVVADYGIDDIDFIKLDVEGFEAKVAAGGQETLSTQRPDICAELHTDKEFEAFSSALPPGYRPWDLNTDSPIEQIDDRWRKARSRDQLFRFLD